MAVSASVHGSASSGSTLVLTFTMSAAITIASGDTAAIAAITLIPAPATAPTVTLGGASMTLIGTVTDTTNINGKMFYYGIVSPATGSSNLVATWTTTSSRWCATCMSFQGTSTASVAAAFTNYSGTDNTTSGTNFSQVTTTGNPGSNAVFSGITIGAAGAVSSRTDTSLNDVAEGSLMRQDTMYAVGTSGSSHTGSWVLSVSEFCMYAGVEVNPGVVTPPYQILQSVTNSVTSQAFTNPITVGSTLGLFYREGDVGQTFTVADNLNGAWTIAGQFPDGTGDTCLVAYHNNAVAGTTTVTITGAGAGSERLILYEIGADASPVPLMFDGFAFDNVSGSGATSTTATCPSVTTTGTAEMLIAMLATNNGNAAWSENGSGSNPSSGWAVIQDSGFKAHVSGVSVSATGTYHEVLTTTVADYWATATLAFKQYQFTALAGQLTEGVVRRPGMGPSFERTMPITASYPPPPVVTVVGGSTLPMMGVG